MHGKLAFSDLVTFVVKKSLLHVAMVATFLDDNKPKTSLNSTVSNTIDLIYFQYTSYLSEKKRLKKHQSGNKKGHSIKETLSVLLTDHLFKAIDDKKVAAMMLIDLKPISNVVLLPCRFQFTN